MSIYAYRTLGFFLNYLYFAKSCSDLSDPSLAGDYVGTYYYFTPRSYRLACCEGELIMQWGTSTLI